MIQYIPWTGHCAAVPMFLLIYYAVLIVLCFGHDFVDVFHKTSVPNYKLGSQYDAQNLQHQEALDEIRAYLNQAKYYTLAKPDLACGLQRILSKYKNLQNTSYETSINQLVIEECVCCNVQLSKVEVDQLWVV